jgi:hypothetical protein
VRGLRPEAATLRAAGGGEETVVLWLCEGETWGGGRRQTQGSRQEGFPEEEMIDFLAVLMLQNNKKVSMFNIKKTKIHDELQRTSFSVCHTAVPQ